MELPPGADVVLVRYGDIGTKSPPVQRSMEDRLVANLRARLERASIDATIEREWTRPVIVPPSGAMEATTDVATDTFGVVSASPARRVESAFVPIIDAIRETAASCYTEGSFAIRARRGDKGLDFTSADIERAGGDAVFDAVPAEVDPTVDLEDPDLTIHVEARREHAYLFKDIVDGSGGLPVGSQDAMVALVSGGIDSPVAAYRVMRRGSPIVPVYFDLGTYGGPDHRARAMEAIARLAAFAGREELDAYVVPAGKAVDRFVEEVDRGRMLVLRRFMFRVADRLADRVGAVGIVTGESLGQKSSQTAANLSATSRVVDRPIHRPLLSYDKAEITDYAKDIGTYRSATIPSGCPSVAPDVVATRATPTWVDRLEPEDIDELVTDALEGVEPVDATVLAAYRQPMAST